MARYIDTKKNLSEIENPVKNVDIGKAIDTSKNLTSLKTTSFGVLSNKSLEQLNSLLAFTPVISFNEDTATVTITCETVGSSIYYTLDGSTPSVSKTKYSAPFSVDKSCTIKAIGAKSGLNNSSVATLEVEYQGGGEVNPPITEEIDMIKKSLHIVKPENSDTSFICPGGNDFLIECNNLGELLFCKIKINSMYASLVNENGYIMPVQAHLMSNTEGGNLVIYFYLPSSSDVSHTPVYNSVQLSGDTVHMAYGDFLYEESGGIESFDIVLYFEN